MARWAGVRSVHGDATPPKDLNIRHSMRASRAFGKRPLPKRRRVGVTQGEKKEKRPPCPWHAPKPAQLHGSTGESRQAVFWEYRRRTRRRPVGRRFQARKCASVVRKPHNMATRYRIPLGDYVASPAGISVTVESAEKPRTRPAAAGGGGVARETHIMGDRKHVMGRDGSREKLQMAKHSAIWTDETQTMQTSSCCGSQTIVYSPRQQRRLCPRT